MTLAYPEVRFHIHGSWTLGHPPVRSFLDVEDPSEGTLIGQVPEATHAVIDAALASARSGLSAWRSIGPARRADLILEACRLLRKRVDEIAALSARELGTPYADARNYVLRAADIVEWDANEGRRLYGRVVPSDPGLRQIVVPEPVGIVAAFTPWNAPVLTSCRKIGSALAAGCAIIVKAAEETPASAMAVVQAFVDAGVPAGVINLLFGNPSLVSERLIDAPEVRMVTFTGSVPIGKQLAQRAAARMKPMLMELGGHAPVIVCEDADVQSAAVRCVTAKYRNGGQACIAPTRFFVHDRVYDAFEDAFAAATRALKIGGPFEPGVAVGPLANERRQRAVDALVKDARTQGARVVCGGELSGGAGYFYPPTVLADVPHSARVLHEEPFGPLACLARFTDLDEAIAAANAVPYGLAGYAFGRAASPLNRIAEKLECGAVAINHLTVSTSGIPFGGMKDSGIGREGGVEGVRCYTVSKTITHLHEN
ncbi:NAD-dependent succinate-semialdehyde dehydrogenase [Xanthobacter flavus]|uniref:NAD-dependent succinate-semialdehyde dehydrogenase n=1 Tax=Xanthobacter flavus TaxID=281 RepID=UPI003729F24D